MGFIDRLFSRVGNDLAPTASRPEPENVVGKDLVDGRHWGGEGLPFGAGVSSASEAAKVSAVNFCVGIIADTAGGVSVDLIEKDYRRSQHELADVLAYAPNPLETGAEFWSSMVYNGALRGAAFAEPVSTSEGLEIWSLDPLRTTVDWKDRSFLLTYQDDGAVARQLGPADLFWFKGLSDATLRPLTPWQMARGSLDFAIALERQGRTFFQNGNRPGGIVTATGELSDEQFAHTKKAIDGWKPGKTALLEGGMDYKPVSENNSDSQLAELITQRTVELARYWRIPLSMVAEVSAGKANSEQQAQDFVKYTIRPLTRRIEQAISRRLLTADMRAAGIRVRINLNSLLRGDSATQWKNAVLARTASLMSADELRVDWFDMPAIGEAWSRDARTPLNSNRAADTITGGQTAPQDQVETEDA